MRPLSDEAKSLIASVRDAPSPLDRLRGHDPRRQGLNRLATLGEWLVVPQLLQLYAADDPLSEDAARTIATLVSGLRPAELARVDEMARSYARVYGGSSDEWWTLTAAGVSRLHRVAADYPAALGVVASHPSGYVREAAVKALGICTTGQEIPFLAIRANDWVWPVAARAGDLLARRLVAHNHAAVLTALPFLVRMLAQRRQNHTRFAEALRAVLVSDGGNHLRARMPGFDTGVRRFVHELVGSNPATADTLLRTALADADAVVRRGAIRRLVAIWDLETSTPILEDMALTDRAPAVRKEALTLLADRRPDRARQLLPRVLLDRAARVRELARFFVRDLGAPLVPRNVYIEGLATRSTSLLTAAIAGLGETGTSADVDVLAGFLGAAPSPVRRAALVASARLDVERGIPLALAALADAAPSVRAAAVHILRVHARRVDFGIIISRLHDIAEAGTRKKLLLLAKEASKWDAAVLLLEALGDSDDDVRRRATELLDGWVAAFNRSHAQLTPAHVARIRALLETHGSEIRDETAALLRFSLKTAAE